MTDQPPRPNLTDMTPQEALAYCGGTVPDSPTQAIANLPRAKHPDWLVNEDSRGVLERMKHLAAGAPPTIEEPPITVALPVQGVALMMICHDADAEKLGRALHSAAAYFAQVVVVDTNPTPAPGAPRTEVELVVAHHAEHHLGRVQLVRSPWAQSFAQARNAGLAVIDEGTWVFNLDADELLVCKDPRVLLWLTSEEAREADGVKVEADAYALRIQSLQKDGPIIGPAMRVFKKGPGYFYASRLHEYVVGLRDGSMKGAAALPGLLILHDGYLPEAIAAGRKGERNRELALLELADRPDDPHSWYLVAQQAPETKQGQALQLKLHEYALANRAEAMGTGWLRDALARSVISACHLAMGFTSAGQPDVAKGYWASAMGLASSARIIMHGGDDTDMAMTGSAELRYWQALALYHLNSPATAIDVLTPIMQVHGRVAVPWMTSSAAWLDRYVLWARCLGAVRRYGEAIAQVELHLSQAKAHAPGWVGRLEALHADLVREGSEWRAQLAEKLGEPLEGPEGQAIDEVTTHA